MKIREYGTIHTNTNNKINYYKITKCPTIMLLINIDQSPFSLCFLIAFYKNTNCSSNHHHPNDDDDDDKNAVFGILLQEETNNNNIHSSSHMIIISSVYSLYSLLYGSKMKLGVDRAISNSSSFMSASMLAKSGVLK